MTFRSPLFLASSPRGFILAAALIALGATCGRLIIGSGTSWTMLAILATGVLFGIAAADSIHLREYQLSIKRWVRSAALVALGFSVFLTLAVALVMSLMQRDNRWYQRYDSFLVTDGSATMLDTNGDMYWVSDSGMNLTTVVLTLLCLLVVFITAAGVGTVIGGIFGTRGRGTGGTLGLGGVGLLVLALGGIAALGIQVSAPYPGVLIFCLPVLVIALGVGSGFLRRP